MYVSEDLCDTESQFFFEIKEGYKVFFAKLLRGPYLFEIFRTSCYVKTSKNVVKGRCF